MSAQIKLQFGLFGVANPLARKSRIPLSDADWNLNPRQNNKRPATLQEWARAVGAPRRPLH